MAECVGIVGVGLMGQAFSHHLLKSGFKVQGFDLDERRLRELHERGGTPVESPAAAARGARFLITSLPTSDIVREVVLGENGVAEAVIAAILGHSVGNVTRKYTHATKAAMRWAVEVVEGLLEDHQGGQAIER